MWHSHARGRLDMQATACWFGVVVGWVVNPTKQMGFTVLLGLDPTYACCGFYPSRTGRKHAACFGGRCFGAWGFSVGGVDFQTAFEAV